MRDEVLLACEGLGAHVAAVRCVARVLAQVVGEVLLARERLLAELAAVGRLARVDPVKQYCYRRRAQAYTFIHLPTDGLIFNNPKCRISLNRIQICNMKSIK